MRLPTAGLIGHPGETRIFETTLAPDDIGAAPWGQSDLLEVESVAVDLTLESVVEGLLVRGSLTVAALLACARCLTDVHDAWTVEVVELFEDPHRVRELDEAPESEPGYELVEDGAIIDLSTLIRDSVLEAVPVRTLCRPDCAGLCPTCGIDRNTGTCDCAATAGTDPRWAALREIRLDD